MATAATCICLQGACDAGVVNEARLQQLAAAAELKVRRVASSPADLLVSRSGSTLAFLLWRPGGAGGSDSGGMVARTTRMAGSFRQAYVLVPHELLGSPVILDASASLGCDGPSFVFMPAGAEFAERALALAAALLPAEAEEAPWREQQAQVAANGEAVSQVLLGLPLPEDGDAAHHANMLRMLGSLQHISERRGDEIAAHTGIDGQAAAAIAAFFQRGARQGEAHLAGTQMQRL